MSDVEAAFSLIGDLKSILEEALEKVKEELDSVQLPTISQEISFQGVSIIFTMDKPVLSGLTSFAVTEAPSVDFPAKSAKVGIVLRKVALTSEDLDYTATGIPFVGDIGREDQKLEAHVVNAGLDFEIKLLVNDDGVPQVDVTTCDVTVGDVDVSITPDARTFVLRTVLQTAKLVLPVAASTTLEKLIETSVNSLLLIAFQAKA